MKRSIALILVLLLLTGCAAPATEVDATQQYTATFLTLFDTVTTIIGRAETEEAFQETTQTIHDDLLRYHELFDIYNDYDGVNNIKTNLVTTKSYGVSHARSREQVKQYLHQHERMPGAAKIGRDWIIPYDTKFPQDLRGMRKKSM